VCNIKLPEWIIVVEENRLIKYKKSEFLEKFDDILKV
jgi:hypothetical protein